ncbi:flippase [Geomesophilobacter sediminis]|uniref:Flippase n=1 Tax=Geomesophilobacter sediminis TaxID=2798584 RepID=A0A8J7S7Y7_9BACT|nr:flippase [Geomesophilobacter sediminis]MBJ6727316.1 flippase [Geomesophilobacter sediminis]
MNSWWMAYLPETVREWLDGRLQFQRAIGNTGWLFLDRIARMVIGLTVGAWVARHLGPTQFGELAYVLSFIAFFQMTSDLQAEGFVLRDLSRETVPAGLVLGTAMRLRLVTSVGSWLCVIAAMALFHPEEPRLILLAAVVGAMLVFQTTDLIDCWFQSQSQSKRTVKVKLYSYLVANGIKVILLLLKAPLIAFAVVMAVEAAIFAAGLALVYRRFPTPEAWTPSLNEAKRLLGLSWPFLISGLMMTAYLRIDQIMLRELLGEKELGIYAAAVPLSQVWNVIPTTLIASVSPFIARKKERSETEYRQALVTVFRLFAVVSLAVALLTALAAPWAVELLYGVQYRQTATVLSLLVFVVLFSFQGMAQSMWVINDDLRGVILASTVVAAVVSVGSNALLIGKFGVVGAALSSIAGQATAVVLMPCLLRRDLRELYQAAFFGARLAAADGAAGAGGQAKRKEEDAPD